jgi:hypothetical protein
LQFSERLSKGIIKHRMGSGCGELPTKDATSQYTEIDYPLLGAESAAGSRAHIVAAMTPRFSALSKKIGRRTPSRGAYGAARTVRSTAAA